MTFQLAFFDDEYRTALFPLAATRPLCEFRFGIFTVREKWERHLAVSSSTLAAQSLEELWPFTPQAGVPLIWVNGRVAPSAQLAAEVKALGPGEALIKGELLVACHAGTDHTPLVLGGSDHLRVNYELRETSAEAIVIRRLHDLFTQNRRALQLDFELIAGGTFQSPDATCTIIGSHPVLMEPGAKAAGCIFNTTEGPVYIAAGAEVMEGSLVRGPIAICSGAQIKMGAKLYADSTIGPGCKVGGEVTNSVFFANSNKSHDGYLGNSVIGEWCNLGADTNTSNLKNNYGPVKVYNYAIGGEEDTGLIFHGLIMADHAKCGINTMFNTGTVVGVAANVFGSGFPPKFIPDFSWGGAEGFTEHSLHKAIETAERVLARRNKKVEAPLRRLFQLVFERTASLRRF
ncbi:MAG: glucose-1-phosphate thymidylyltransferase [Bacteroidia bacterium]|jgi:UDP-N-acetylglucosamine diphosphorylase/glucosamine-1-phosphate N-acetyltransferase|nr:glucose-1-phosphate thymidylyltransferase [Bacteroidia bacterium]